MQKKMMYATVGRTESEFPARRLTIQSGRPRKRKTERLGDVYITCEGEKKGWLERRSLVYDMEALSVLRSLVRDIPYGSSRLKERCTTTMYKITFQALARSVLRAKTIQSYRLISIITKIYQNVRSQEKTSKQDAQKFSIVVPIPLSLAILTNSPPTTTSISPIPTHLKMTLPLVNHSFNPLSSCN
jgi:hypothetical protein